MIQLEKWVDPGYGHEYYYFIYRSFYKDGYDHNSWFHTVQTVKGFV